MFWLPACISSFEHWPSGACLLLLVIVLYPPGFRCLLFTQHLAARIQCALPSAGVSFLCFLLVCCFDVYSELRLAYAVEWWMSPTLFLWLLTPNSFSIMFFWSILEFYNGSSLLQNLKHITVTRFFLCFSPSTINLGSLLLCKIFENLIA